MSSGEELATVAVTNKLNPSLQTRPLARPDHPAGTGIELRQGHDAGRGELLFRLLDDGIMREYSDAEWDVPAHSSKARETRAVWYCADSTPASDPPCMLQGFHAKGL